MHFIDLCTAICQELHEVLLIKYVREKSNSRVRQKELRTEDRLTALSRLSSNSKVQTLEIQQVDRIQRSMKYLS